MISLLIWKDGRESQCWVVPGRDALISHRGGTTAFERVGMDRGMFVYEERETIHERKPLELVQT